MKRFGHIILFLILSAAGRLIAQSNNPAPYCNGNYSSGNCLQGSNQPNNPNNGVNDFIDFFRTSGANTNITNDSSGCNGLNNNYANYCNQYMVAQPGQLITCSLKAGITFAQGFAIFIDWNQDFTFAVPGERVAATPNVPPPNSWTTLTFSIPAGQAPGAYRLRVRCAFATPGTAITPCGQFGFGETEDYTIYVGSPPPNVGQITATAVAIADTICAGQPINFIGIASATSGITYTWTGPGSFTSTSQNPVIPVATPSMSGTYTLIASNQSCPGSATVSIRVVPYPVFSIIPSHTICQNGFTNAIVTLPPGASYANYTYSWAPTPTAGIASPNNWNTMVSPPPLAPSVSLAVMVYSVTVSPVILPFCSVTQTMSIQVNNPAVNSLTLNPPVCNTFTLQQFAASPSGGVWSGAAAVSPSGVMNPALAAIGSNTVQYSVTIGNCVASIRDTFYVNRFNTAALSSTLNLVCVQNAPINLMNIVQTTVTGGWSGQSVSGNMFNPNGLPTGVYPLTYTTTSTPTAGVCNSSTVLQVSVFNPPTPTIAPIQPRCTNAGTVQLTAFPAGGTWTNNSGVSVGGVQTPSLNNIGNNFVTYSAGQGTCVASVTASFQVSEFRTAQLTGSVSPMCVSSNPFNLLSIVQNTNGTWSGMNVSNNIFSPNPLPTNIYNFTYSITSTPNATMCPDSRTLAISVLNPPTPEITQVGPFCSKDGSVQLVVTPNTGSWTALPYVNQNGVFTASLAPVGSNFVQYIIGTSTCNAQQTKFISVEGFVTAALTTSALPNQCNTNLPFNLSPISLSSAGKWSGPAVLGNNFDPAVSGAGSFILTHTTASFPSNLCPDQATVAVTVFSLAPPVVMETGPFCNNSAPVQLTVSPLGGLFGGDNTQGVTNSGIFNPANGIIGDNIVSYSITSGPCIAYAQSTIAVQKFVSADFFSEGEIAYCKNSKAFNLNSLVLNPGGLWSGPGITGNMFDPAAANIGDNNVIVYQTYSSPLPLLCPDSKSIRIKVDNIPNVSIASSAQKACAPAEIVFNIPNANTGTAQWTIGDGSVPAEGLQNTHLFTSIGDYSVFVTYTLGACTATAALDNAVTIMESPSASFEFERAEISISEPKAGLINTSNILSANKYKWEIQGMEPRYEIHPTVTFPKVGSYVVKLTATSYEGCTHSVSKIIEVKNDFNVFIPNSFTPNADGLNDYFQPVFSPYGLNAKTYEMEVFDRWGHVLFYTQDAAKGWDGTFQNKGDVQLKQDVYIYRIRFKDIEGQIHQRNGTLSLLNE